MNHFSSLNPYVIKERNEQIGRGYISTRQKGR